MATIKEEDCGWFVAYVYVERAKVSNTGEEHLFVLSFEADEQQTRALDPGAYRAADGDASAPDGAWCVVRAKAETMEE